jgi:hypothetical protein
LTEDFDDEDIDLLILTLSENKVLEFVEIGGIDLSNYAVHLI